METRILIPTAQNLALAASSLREGAPVGMPTETVYGLAAPLGDERALNAVFSAKERPLFDPLILHVGTKDLDALAAAGVVDLSRLSAAELRTASALMARFWPGPLTLLLPRGPAVPDLVTAGLPRVGVRMPAHMVAQALIAAAGAPLAAPSANRFGRISPTSADAVRAELGGRISYILDGGSCTVGLESTVAAPQGEGLTVLRVGGISIEALSEALDGAPVTLQPKNARGESGGVEAPGQLASHYAPAKPLRLMAEGLAEALSRMPTHGRLGFLLWSGNAEERRRELCEAMPGRPIVVRVLTENGDAAEAARNLFASLRALDESPAELLFAELAPGAQGLAHAINDRLGRAAAR